jgi:hypothetical protein
VQILKQQAVTTLKADFTQLRTTASLTVVDEAMRLVRQAYDELGHEKFEAMVQDAIERRFISGHLPIDTLPKEVQARAKAHTMQDFVAKHISPELLAKWQARTAAWVAKGL